MRFVSHQTLIPFISMLFAIVNGWLITLKSSFVNPLQAFFLINGNAFNQ